MAATVIRWWFGVTWLLASLGGVIAAPIQLVEGDAGGIYLLGGSLIIGACGYALHPWGLQRQRRLTRGTSAARSARTCRRPRSRARSRLAGRGKLEW